MTLLINAYRYATGGGGTADAMFTWDADEYDGLFAWMGTDGGINGFNNPAGSNVQVGYTATISSLLAAGYEAVNATDHLSAEGSYGVVHTQSAVGSWWQADFGADGTFRPTHYAIRCRPGTDQLMRNWKLQGSDNGTDWTDLDEQVNNTEQSGSQTWFSGAVAGDTAYRYLRILQTGANSSSDQYLVFAEIEFWGDWYGPTPDPAADLGTPDDTTTWDTDDYDGLFNWMGTDDGVEAFDNPATSVARQVTYTATQSSDQDGTRTADKASDHSLDANNGSTHTGNAANSWWKADFGAGNTLKVEHYGIRGRSSGGQHPRSWKLQGSNDDSTWYDLDLRHLDLTIGDGTWFSGSVTDSRKWRYLRILQFRSNSAAADYLCLGEVEFWGDWYGAVPV